MTEMQMRRVITGRGPDGRATVLTDGAPASVTHTRPGQESIRVDGTDLPELAAGEGLVAELWRALPGAQPDLDLTEAGGAFSLETAPGSARFVMTRYAAGRETPLHETPTVDYDFLLAGSLTYIAEDGTEVLLRPGDAIVVRGVHAWRAGPEGATLGIVMTRS